MEIEQIVEATTDDEETAKELTKTLEILLEDLS